MGQEQYDHVAVEKKWQDAWYAAGAFTAPDRPAKQKSYVLDMFPYPSGDGLHVGHPEGYTASDIFSRYLRMQGKDVLHPMGWDAFGLPAENYAIKTGTHPAETTKANIATFKRQIQSLGFSYDWSREVNTTDPAYYKWTQWIFLKLFEKGLAYEAEAPINWCPKDKTGLANEEVVGGKCDRCGTVVEKKNIRQWLVKITDAKYIERLLNDLDKLDWPESIKHLQRNWIGKSEGAEVIFETNAAPHYVFIHGYNSTPASFFFPWLKQQLEARGARVDAPVLPNPLNPDVLAQAKYVAKHVKLTPQTIIVAHSLGVAVALKVLEKSKVRIAKLISAGGFVEAKFKDHARPFESTFPKTFDYAAINQHVGETRILRAADDFAVPGEQADVLSQALHGTIFDIQTVKSHFTADQEVSVLKECTEDITVFTTRPDTLFGATYMVLSPEHSLVPQITADKQWKAVEKYQKQASHKSDIDRTDLSKAKTGVFTGAFAINPVNQAKIPVWIADYVLSSYGTGAIMAVPAHDERDFAFAKKYKLPIRRVVEPKFVAKPEGESAVHPGEPFVRRNAISAIIRNPKDDTYLCIAWKTVHMHGLVTGGVDEGEDVVEAAKREIREETGYKNVRFVRNPDFAIHSQFYHRVKQENRWARFQYLFFELVNDTRDPVDKKEAALHQVVWKKKNEFEAFFSVIEGKFSRTLIEDPDYIFTGDGVMQNSGAYDWMDSVEAKRLIVEKLQQAGKGKFAINYKLRDWVFSRQRYWGEPIPIVHCPKDGIIGVSEEQLPVILPEVKKYEPTGTGESPLANIKDWVNTTCPQCGGPAKRETNTMPQWAGSNWYFLRYCDPHNDQQLADPAKLKAWLPVDTYIGGAEHAVLHLLYARFIYKFLFDIGAVPKEVGDEPFTKLINQGLILAEDGQKMSKSRGNVITPDLIVREYGADSLRMFEMFMGPLQDAKPWSTRGIVGVRRFVEKVWQLQDKVKEGAELNRETHALVKQIGSDIASFSLNTAVSNFMKWVNTAMDWTSVSKKEFETFLTVLSPFAPHLAQELWSKLGHEDEVHSQQWPSFDASKVVAENVEVVVQVNGKVRDKFTVASGISDEELKAMALASEKVKLWLVGKPPKKVIVVKGKLVSIVV